MASATCAQQTEQDTPSALTDIQSPASELEGCDIAFKSAETREKAKWIPPEAVNSISPHTLARVSEVMVMDSQCGVLVHKRSLHNIPYRKAQQLFTKHMKAIGQTCLNPYFRDEGIDFFYLCKNDVFLVAVHPSSEEEKPISIILYLDFLKRLYEVLKDCIGAVNEPYITVNRMLVFEILDEMLTLGYGHVSSYNEVKPQLSFDPIRPKIPQQDELASRFFGINTGDRGRQHARASEPKQKAPNCAYINIVEGLSAVVGPNGQVLSSELWGKLSLISTLERPAPIVIELNPDLVIRSSASEKGQVAGAVHIENPSFHTCVDATHLAHNKILRVFPPPDQTRLMVYTLSDSACINIPVVLIPKLTVIDGSRDQNLSMRLINQAENRATASYIKVKVKLPQWVISVSTTRSGDHQYSQYHQAEKVVEWEVRRSPGGSEELITFRLVTQVDKHIELADIGPIILSFNFTNFSASALRVRMARIESQSKREPGSPSPECFFGVSTKAASFTVKTDSGINGDEAAWL